MEIRTMRYKLFYIFIIILIVVSCKSYKEKENELPDTEYRGKINVSADETFKPIVDELVKVYESNNRDTKINVDYKPEAECLNDLLNDSIRMIIVTRKYSDDERKLLTYLDQHGRITLKEFSKLTRCSFKKAQKIIVSLILADILIPNTSEKEEYFTAVN